nr:WD40 repeat domain containing protein [Haemonchus contortus]
MKTYDIVPPSNVFPPPVHATLSTRSRCIFVANPLTVHSLHNIDVEVPTLPFNGHVDCLRLSMDERNLAVASNDLIKLIDLTRGRGIRNLSGHSSTVKAITPRRSTVYSWVSGSLDCSWIVWDSRSHPANVLQVRTTGPVRCVELSPDDIILTVGTDSTLQLYDMRKREYLKQFPSPTHGATFHPSQRMVATFGAERVVRFWCLDELGPIAMSDAFSSEIRCAQFASPSSRIDPVLCACTDHYVKTLTYEPCESLAVNQLGDLRKVLNMNVSADGVGVICTDSVGAVSYSVIPMEELVQGPRDSVDFSDDGEDDDISLSDEVAILTLRGESPSIPLPRETISVPSAIHLSSSDCGIDNTLSSGSNRVSLPVRSSSSDRGTSHRTPSRNPLKRRTETDRSILGRPRSPSMSAIHSSNDSQSSRLRDGSRLICRSVSPLNGASTRETIVVAPRSVEKMRPLAPTTSTKPPREPNRSLQRDGRVNAYASTDDANPQSRKNSTQGLSLEEFAAKAEKGHYMAIMQAEKTSIGVHQLTASLKHGGICAMLKDGLFADESAVTVMLRMFNETKRWDINICSMYLSRIKDFLQDTSLPESCRQVALSSLQCIATGLIDSLRICTRAPVSTIGVDVAAEERKKKADDCIQELKDLRDRREHFYRKLSQEEVYRLDAIMVFLKPL